MLREKQATPHGAPMTDSAELDLALEDAGGLSPFGVQKQATVRLSSASMIQGSETIQALAVLGILGAQGRATAQSALVMALAALSPSGTQAANPAQSLIAVVEMLVGLTEDNFLASLTDDDCQRLAAARDKLIDLAGEDENHLFTPLRDFIGNLIEKYEEKRDIVILSEPPDPRGALLNLGPLGLEAAYGDDEPEYTLDMLIEENPDYKGPSVESGYGRHSAGRGLAAAYGDDEPEYTTDMLIEENPNYGKI